MTVPRALERARTVVQQTMTAEATVQRKTRTGDRAGGNVEGWGDVATYPCSFAEYNVRSLERENTARVQAISYWQFVFPSNADVRVTDRLVVGARTFEVTGGGAGSVSISVRILALEIL